MLLVRSKCIKMVICHQYFLWGGRRYTIPHRFQGDAGRPFEVPPQVSQNGRGNGLKSHSTPPIKTRPDHDNDREELPNNNDGNINFVTSDDEEWDALPNFHMDEDVDLDECRVPEDNEHHMEDDNVHAGNCR